MKKKLFKTKATKTHMIDYKQSKVWRARRQKFAIEGAVCGGLRAKPPAAGDTGDWGQSPQRLRILHFFFKNNLVLGLYW